MMKQPAENTNALPEEEARARESASRIYMDSPAVKEEIAMHAHHYWQERGASGDVPTRKIGNEQRALCETALRPAKQHSRTEFVTVRTLLPMES